MGESRLAIVVVLGTRKATCVCGAKRENEQKIKSCVGVEPIVSVLVGSVVCKSC